MVATSNRDRKNSENTPLGVIGQANGAIVKIHDMLDDVEPDAGPLATGRFLGQGKVFVKDLMD